MPERLALARQRKLSHADFLELVLADEIARRESCSAMLRALTRLRAARLDNTFAAEIRKLAHVDLLILDDFALRPLDATETNDFYELVVERHRRASTIVTSNREPSEWLTMMSYALLAQSAVDRLTSGAHTLIIEGPLLPTTPPTPARRRRLQRRGPRLTHASRWSHAPGNALVPSRWQATSDMATHHDAQVDAQVTAIRQRPLDQGLDTFVWVDALVVEVREDGRVWDSGYRQVPHPHRHRRTRPAREPAETTEALTA